MELDDFFRDQRSMLEQVQRFDEFVTGQKMLATETVGIGALLNGVALKRSGDDSAAGGNAGLMDARAGAGSEPGMGFAKLHVRFAEGDAFDLAHGGIGGEQEFELSFE